MPCYSIYFFSIFATFSSCTSCPVSQNWLLKQANLRKISLGLIFLNRKKKHKNRLFSKQIWRNRKTPLERECLWHSSGAFLFFYFVLEKKLQIYLQRENVQDYLSILKLNRKKKKNLTDGEGGEWTRKNVGACTPGVHHSSPYMWEALPTTGVHAGAC